MRCFGLPLFNAFTREALAARLGLLPFSVIIDNVRFWPIADVRIIRIQCRFGGRADMGLIGVNVRFLPKADIGLF